MEFCDECGSMMKTEGDTWVCGSCYNKQPRDSQEEETMTVRDRQQGREEPPLARSTYSSNETRQKPCPMDDCDNDQARYETMPEPGGSYEVRLFTCVECGHKWRES